MGKHLRRVLIALMVCTGLSASSQTVIDVVDGMLFSDTDWNADTVRVHADVFVVNSKLTIAPGTWVKFYGYYQLYVWGTLIAQGTPEDSIVFTVPQQHVSTGWNALYFEDTPGPDSSVISYCRIHHSKRANDGGGIFIKNTNIVRIDHCRISGNSGNVGGGIYCNNSSPVILHNKITANTSSSNGAGIAAVSLSKPVILHNTITYNNAGLNSGGGIYIDNATPIIYNNAISNNTARYGGGVYFKTSAAKFTNNLVCNNYGSTNGGGLFFFTASPNINNNTIANNQAATRGGGMAANNNADPVLTNNILWGNTAGTAGPQVYLQADNCDPNFLYNVVQGGTPAFNVVGTYTGTYSNNLTTDPLFVSPTAGVGTSFNGLSANWAPQPSSLCVNGGKTDTTGLQLPAQDMAGNPRNNGRVDIGAYEYNAPMDVVADIIDSANVSCYGGNDGTARAKGFDGTTPYLYAWSNGQNDSIATGLVADTWYTVTVTDNSSNAATTRVRLSQPAEVVADAGIDDVVCQGESASLTATGGGTYNWSGGLGTNATVLPSPIATTTYTVTVNVNGCSDSDAVTVTVNAVPTANAGADDALCKGEAANMTASGGGTYSWSHGLGTNAGVTPSPTTTTTYVVTVTVGGCTDSDDVEMTVKTNPTAVASNDTSICAGAAASLTVSGGTSYSWNTGSTENAIAPAPGSTTTYTATVIMNGCTDADEVVVTVNPLPTTTVNSPSVCQGNQTTLIASGATTYAWSTTATTMTIDVTPTLTTTYTVTGVSASGCSDSESGVVTVVNSPAADAGSDGFHCLGSVTTLTATGGDTYEWSGGLGATAAVAVSPLSNTTYTVTVTIGGGCSASADVALTVVTAPVANAGPDDAFCQGGSTIMTATGGVSYQWSSGCTTAACSVSVGGGYTVTVTDANGCSASDDLTISVNALPTVDAGPPKTICQGKVTMLTASGGVSYSWNTGNTEETFAVAPMSTSTYTVTGTNGLGCTASDFTVITARTNPTADAGEDMDHCIGSFTSLIATGGIITWSTGATTTSITVSPASTTTYTVTATTPTGCSNTDDMVLTVVPLPTADAGADGTICKGDILALTASGGSSYAWSGGLDSAAVVMVSPPASTTYTVTITVGTCTDSDDVVVYVNPLPTADAGGDTSVCQGTSATLTASGGQSYVWSSGCTTAACSVSLAGDYTVTVTDAGGCTDLDEAFVAVNPLPTANAGADTSFCLGSAIALNASGGISYLWSSGCTDATCSISVGGNYTVTVTDANGCEDSDVVVITANALPTANAGVDQTICVGDSTTLSASGGSTYTWNTTETTASIEVLPTVSSTYTVTVTGAGGCTDSDEVVVTVQSAATVDLGDPFNACKTGNKIGLNAEVTLAGGLVWGIKNGSGFFSPGNTGLSLNYSPTVADYNNGFVKLYATTTGNGVCAAAVDTVQVTFVDMPTAYAGADTTICRYDAVLNITGSVTHAVGVLWRSNGTGTFVPTDTALNAQYVFSANDLNMPEVIMGLNVSGDPACPIVYDGMSVSFHKNTVAQTGADKTICYGDSVMLTATGGSSYTWNTSQTSGSIYVAPTVHTTYSVIADNGTGCTGTDAVVVYSVPRVQAGLNVPDTMACIGNTLSFKDASTGPVGSWTWHFGDGGTVQQKNPTYAYSASGVYSPSLVVTSHLYGVTCTDTAIWHDGVLIPPNPNVDISNDTTICKGGSATLIVNGAKTYIWSHGATGDNVAVSPLMTKSYTVTATDSLGCQNTERVSVTVNLLPTASVGVDRSVCFGDTVDITATGGNTYSWSSGETTSSITVAATATATYTVTATLVSGCAATDDLVVSVFTLPAADAGPDQVICMGDQISLTASGGATYTWSNGGQGASIVVAPADTSTYWVTVTDAHACTDADSVTVSVNVLPEAAINGPDSVCAGDLINLVASGGVSYNWSEGTTADTLTVVAGITKTFAVTVTSSTSCQDVVGKQVTVLPNPVVDIGSDVIICEGNSVSLSASGGESYLWSTLETSTSITLIPLADTAVFVTVSSSSGCQTKDSVLITVNDLPLANAGLDVEICEGLSAGLGATGGASYRWSTGESWQIIEVAPLVTASYTVTVTGSNGCTNVDDVKVTVRPLPVFDRLADRAICLGDTTQMVVAGGVMYKWSNGMATPTVEVVPATTTTYKVTVYTTHCSATDDVVVTVDRQAVVDAGADDITCADNASFSLNGSVANTTGGIWSSSGSGFFSPSNTSLTPDYYPSAADKISGVVRFTLVSTGNGGCDAVSDTMTGIVSPNTTISAGPDLEACKLDAAVILNGSLNKPVGAKWTTTGKGTFLPSDTALHTTYYFSPTDKVQSSLGFTISTTGDTVCSVQQDGMSVTILPVPYVSAGADQTVCYQAEASLKASTAVHYAWSTGDTTASITVNPSVTTTYGLTVTDAKGCPGTDQMVVHVVPEITAGFTVSDTFSCLNGPVSFTDLSTGVSGSRLWDFGDGTTSGLKNPVHSYASADTFDISLVVTSTLYGVYCRDTMIERDVILVSGGPVAKAGADQEICIGSSTEIIVSGGVSYLWSNGSTLDTLQVAPVTTSTYTATVVDEQGCYNTDQIKIIVRSLPKANAGADIKYCRGNSAVLTATGGATYVWNTGESTAAITATTATTATYTVTAYSAGCSDDDQVVVTVLSLPVANAGLDKTVCTGSLATLNASGGGTYKWSHGPLLAQTNVRPSVTTNYIVTVTDNNACTDKDTVTVVVASLPLANAGPDTTVCKGSLTQLTASGGLKYRWGNGDTSRFHMVSPLKATMYYVTVTTDHGCSGIDNVLVSVTEAPSVNLGNDRSSCAGQAVALNVSASGSFVWSTGDTTAGISVSPSVTTSYSVTATGVNGCVGSDEVVIHVRDLPVISAGPDKTVCSGSSVKLIGSGAMTYQWSPATSLTNTAIAEPSASPVQKTTYTLTGMDVNGCANTDQVVVSVLAVPVAFAGADVVICTSETVYLKAQGGITYNWSSSQTGSQISVTPTATTKYVVTAYTSAGCSDDDEVWVTIHGGVKASLGADQSVCRGASKTLTATGGASYIWNTGSTGNPIVVSPTTQTTYTVTATDQGCTGTDELVVLITDLPVLTHTRDTAICRGASVKLQAQGAQSYQWNTGQVTSSIVVAPVVNKVYAVTAIGQNGCAVQGTMKVDLYGGDAGFIVAIDSLTATFTASVTGTITDRYWDFGDGISSNQTAPQHVYSKGGIYEVCLTVSVSETGCQTSVCDFVEIEVDASTLSARFDYQVDVAGMRVDLVDQSIGPVYAWFWDFGNGQTSTLRNPSVVYQTPGVYDICLTVQNTDASKQAHYCTQVLVGDDPVTAGFGVLVNAQTRTVSLTDESTGDISQWYWEFGDGQFSVQSSPQHQYAENGAYQVCLTVRNVVSGLQNKSCKQVTIGADALSASFTLVKDTVSKRVYFSDASKGPVELWHWDFGDGATSSLKNPQHTFGEGSFEVCLTVYNESSSKMSSSCRVVEFGSNLCHADFSVVVDAPTSTIYLAAQSSGQLSEWYWTFGDGRTGDGPSPVHTYQLPGSYEVCLIAQNGNGSCSSGACETVVVGSTYCSADFEYFVDQENMLVTLLGPSNGNVVTWIWTLDGSRQLKGKSQQYKYNITGLNKVSLKTVTATGCVSERVAYLKLPAAGQTACFAEFDFTVNPASKTVKFSNKSTGSMSEYSWAFGDGTFSDQINPTHKYDSPGIYVVRLTSGNVAGTCADYYEARVQVGAAACEAFYIDYDDVADLTIQFDNISYSKSNVYYWEFGDGTLSVEPTPRHTFPAAGYYQVSVTAKDTVTGCMHHYEDRVLVKDGGSDCEADFTYYQDWTYNIVTFVNTSAYNELTTVHWTFGNGKETNLLAPRHRYKKAGYYEVCLTITDAGSGCRNTTCRYIQVGEPVGQCVANYFYAVAVADKKVSFSDRSLGSPTYHKWNFGDDQLSYQKNPLHQYEQAGIYHVYMLIRNKTNGCYDFYNDLINVGGEEGFKCAFGYVEDSTFNTKGVLPIDFKGAAYGDPAAIEWDFGDGTTSNTTMSPVHEYEKPGVYTVCLTITDDRIGQSDSYCEQIYVATAQSVDEQSKGVDGLIVYPNPSNEDAFLFYSLPERGQVRVGLFDMHGRQVEELIHAVQSSGTHKQRWTRGILENGIYYLRLQYQEQVIVKKLVLVD